MTINKSKIIQGLFWCAFATVTYALTFQFDQSLGEYKYGASGWPRLITIVIFICGIAQVVSGIYKIQKLKKTGTKDTELPRFTGATSYLLKKRIIIFAIPTAYVLLLPYTGFYSTTPIFLVVFMILLGEKHWYNILGVTALCMV